MYDRVFFLSTVKEGRTRRRGRRKEKEDGGAVAVAVDGSASLIQFLG